MTRHPVAVKLAREELDRGRTVRLRVSGRSMAPLIEPGDVALVHRVSPEELRRGDLILIEQEGTFLVHRLVAANTHGVRTKGDTASHPDPVVAPRDVLGRVVSVEKGEGRIELDAGRWPVVNRLLGLLGWCEVNLFAAGQILKRRRARAQSGRWSQWLASRAAVPFRWLTRWLLIHMGGCTDDLTG